MLFSIAFWTSVSYLTIKLLTMLNITVVSYFTMILKDIGLYLLTSRVPQIL
ncbi:hypothetical protein Lalb_Chr19g0125101 [Lupinus albus]|uniref:Uncharacterized protein n=1 Tax=Lupinus albus TaxID=3870 RepID=A0A6A4NMN3_LUPAL|nr:hypothetical protein Lalb_Chr19g0125101 [Lupinus albus]